MLQYHAHKSLLYICAMSSKKVRVRFAPSPTGGLHLGGMRTALFNYLFARKNNGDFILRIEDTDQTRYVQGAEEYIMKCLNWCGIKPDESPEKPGPFAPYRQSERKDIYRKYAEQLVANGQAYYAFDTADELNEERKKDPNFRYGIGNRQRLRNALAMSSDELSAMRESASPCVIRIKMPEDETITFTDAIRGEVSFAANLTDDKVLLKADGMPTYHLAVVVDDYLMQISHAFRGEEWLPSAPVHILLWRNLFGEEAMPQWAHLPLILKPDGNGKLSKRDGERLGFPVFAMNWTDPRSNEFTAGFKERGYLPEAFINMLALLGWNDGTDKELFSMQELETVFSLERMQNSGAKFDIEKAKWYNQEWIKRLPVDSLAKTVKPWFEAAGIDTRDAIYFESAINLVKERCTLLPDFLTQAGFFFVAPAAPQTDIIKGKWSLDKQSFFIEWSNAIDESMNAVSLEQTFKTIAESKNIKPGELMLPLRIMLVGDKFGPGVFEIAALLGVSETKKRIEKVIELMA